MANMKRPNVPEEYPDVLSEDQLRALLKACNGTGFEDRRDTAIIRLFVDSGMRLSELTGLNVDDLDFGTNVASSSYTVGPPPRRRIPERPGAAIDHPYKTAPALHGSL
jgi:integrase